jgi:predicted glycoside hydrolase/deacetylase ChbG (UPF0249 family)
MTGAVRLIVNADDFGRSPGVSRGIVEAHRDGIVTSTTLMANLPWAAAAVELARTEPNLDLGLHLSVCYGPPLARPDSSLVGDDGRLDRDLVALARRIQPDDVEREARAQLARFVELTGRLPSHLDSHLHLHAWPVCWEPIARIAREYGLPVRPASPELANYLRARAIRTVDHFVDDFFAPGQMTIYNLVAVLDRLPRGTSELMCHPGYADGALADSSFREQRERELEILRAPEIRQAITERGIVLTTHRELPRA